MRGIGWAILYHDPLVDRLYNWWVSGHEVDHPAGFDPILVLDVFEHAYMVDYGTSERSEYVKAFFANLNWKVVEQRFDETKARRVASRFAI